MGSNDLLGKHCSLLSCSLTCRSGRSRPAETGRHLNSLWHEGGLSSYLVMPHNWGRDPAFKKAGAQTMRLRTVVWDNFVAKTASSFSATYGGNIIAVDLFTTFEQVFNNPSDFCFKNVTDTAPTTTDWPNYLFDVPGSNGTGGEYHFGPRGHNLIEQVMQYYLTRGWDWANTTKDPAAAKSKLNADL